MPLWKYQLQRLPQLNGSSVICPFFHQLTQFNTNCSHQSELELCTCAEEVTHGPVLRFWLGFNKKADESIFWWSMHFGRAGLSHGVFPSLFHCTAQHSMDRQTENNSFSWWGKENPLFQNEGRKHTDAGSCV